MASIPTLPSAPPPIRRRRSAFGPLLLIAIGVLFLLRNLGVVSHAAFWHWFANWWPAILIAVGIVRLVEWQLALRGGVTAPRFPAWGVVFLVFLVILGICASGTRGINWTAVGDSMQWDEDLGNLFDQKHDFDESAQHEFTPGALVRVDNARGDVTVSTSPDSLIHVSARNSVRGSDSEARRIEESSKPSITTEGGIFVIQGAQNNQVRSDLNIQLPSKAGLELNLGRGDIKVSGIQGDVHVNTRRGDIELRNLGGNATAGLHGSSLTAEKIQGSLTVSGRVDSVNVSDTGSVEVGGEYLGEMQTERIPKGVRFHSPRTELALASVAGRMAINRDEVNGNNIGGPIQLRTNAKNVQFENIAGDISIEDSDAEIELQPATLGNISVVNHKGSIRLVLPPGANASLTARTSDGDIESSEFSGLQTQTTGNSTQASGNIGKGGVRVTLNTDRASIEIQKSAGKTTKEDQEQ